MCVAHAVDHGKPFGRLIDRQLINLIVGCMVNRGHWRTITTPIISSGLKRQKKTHTHTQEGGERVEEDGREGGKRGRATPFPSWRGEKLLCLERVEKK